MVLEEAKTNKYSEVGLAYKFYHAQQKSYLFKCATDKVILKTELHNITLPKGANLFQLQDSVYFIHAEFRRFGPTCNKGDIISLQRFEL